MSSVIRFFLSSLSLTMLTVGVVFLSSIILETKKFSDVVYFLYFIPLVIELSIFGQHYSILRKASKKELSSGVWKLDRRKLYLGAIICFLLVYFVYDGVGNGSLLLLSILMFISLRLSSAFLRINENLFISVVAERSVQIVVSLVLVIFMLFNIGIDWLELVLLTVTASFYLLLFLKFRTNFPIVNSAIDGRTDTTYELNMFCTIGSMLLVKSLDKIIIANYFMPTDFSKFVIIFQLYLPFPILAGFIFQYYMPKLASKGYVTFRKKYSAIIVLMCVVLWYVVSDLSYWLYFYLYSGKYDFALNEIRLVIASGLMYVLYQPLALVIVTIANNKNLLALNMLNIISVCSYLAFILFAIQSENLFFALVGFLIFWIVKLCSGLLVVREVDGFHWD